MDKIPYVIPQFCPSFLTYHSSTLHYVQKNGQASPSSLQDNRIRRGVPPPGVKDVKDKYLEIAQIKPDIKVMNQ